MSAQNLVRFPPDFVDRVLALPWGALPRRGAGGTGERAGRHGAGLEFEEHRAYRPGDDLARVDWQVFARTKKPFLKVQRIQEAQRELVLVDLSASMDFGAEPKVDRALRIAAALALALAARGASAEIIPLGAEEALGPVRLERLAGARELLATLERWRATADEDELHRARLRLLERRSLARAPRAWILSDLYALAGWAQFSEQLSARALHPRLLRILDPEERSPSLTEPVEWIDAETGERWIASDPEVALAGYAQRFAAHAERLRQLAERHRLPLRELSEPAQDLAELVRFERSRSAR
ncbi:MAG: DUF58 domain-containing protein [Planctomycetes bacterium]|nr:DUF58 domain-containing protein [Planctomycetota bacterium]